MRLFPPGVPISKRLLDLVITTAGLIVLAPFLAVIAWLVRRSLGSPVLFRQARPGYRGQPFCIYKFRTMTDERDEQNRLLPDEQRITRLGHFLRAFSIDELPELINVLRGEMSWVGPRPLLTQYLERYNTEQRRRHDVLPGITGWAQVNGRNTLTWEDKFRLDVWYVDHWSLRLDIKILWLTIWTVLRREGISAPGRATAEEFMGSPPEIAKLKNKSAIRRFWNAFCHENSQVDPSCPYQIWHFGDTRDLANNLTELVLERKKTATSGLAWEEELEPSFAPVVNGYSLIIDFDSRPQCIIQTLEVRELPFDEVDAQFAAEEGEGDLSLEYWRTAHWRAFARTCERLGRQPDPKMPVVCERFRVVFPGR